MAAHLKYKSGDSWVDYNLVVYPVGALYISYSSTSPATLFGGTWVAITGRFLYANADTGTGGSNTQTLSVDNLPNIHGKLEIRGYEDAFMSTSAIGEGVFKLDGHSDRCYVFERTEGLYEGWGGFSMNFGSGKAHNNMPAYQSVYCWRRTA